VTVTRPEYVTKTAGGRTETRPARTTEYDIKTAGNDGKERSDIELIKSAHNIFNNAEIAAVEDTAGERDIDPDEQDEEASYPADWDDFDDEAAEVRNEERNNILKNVRGVTFDSLVRAVGREMANGIRKKMPPGFIKTKANGGRDIGDVAKSAVEQVGYEITAAACGQAFNVTAERASAVLEY
jgi:hypothetical protein